MERDDLPDFSILGFLSLFGSVFPISSPPVSSVRSSFAVFISSEPLSSSRDVAREGSVSSDGSKGLGTVTGLRGA